MIIKVILSSTLALFLSVSLTSCTTTYSKVQSTEADLETSKLNNGKIFTYDFDRTVPQMNVGINGTFIVKDRCLLLKSPEMNILMTPIFPARTSYWDKKDGIVYIENSAFPINIPISDTNGVLIKASDRSKFGLNNFVSKANASCIKEDWVRFGIN